MGCAQRMNLFGDVSIPQSRPGERKMRGGGLRLYHRLDMRQSFSERVEVLWHRLPSGGGGVTSLWCSRNLLMWCVGFGGDGLMVIWTILAFSSNLNE